MSEEFWFFSEGKVLAAQDGPAADLVEVLDPIPEAAALGEERVREDSDRSREPDSLVRAEARLALATASF